MSSVKQACPLCGNPATYEICLDPYCKHFTCQQCREFFIDAYSEKRLASLPEEPKTERLTTLQKMSKDCPSDAVFVIREPRDDERKGDGGGTWIEMVWGYLKR